MVYSLHDDATGASASILPSFGFNLFDLRLPVGGQVRPLLDAAADFAENPSHPARSGTPILFPFPNRIRDGHFHVWGSVPSSCRPRMALTPSMASPWMRAGMSSTHAASAEAAYVAGRYQIAKQSPASRSLWPTDAILEVRYSLAGRRLTMSVTVSNPTADDLPYGFGIHPYFRLPFSPGADLEQTRVIFPASQLLGSQRFSAHRRSSTGRYATRFPDRPVHERAPAR